MNFRLKSSRHIARALEKRKNEERTKNQWFNVIRYDKCLMANNIL